MGSSLFEQAYYTWDKSEIVRYGAGWGVHVTSNQDEMFTNECIALANGLSEGKREAVGEYLLYSKKWECFAAVGVSLRPEGDEAHRKNLLCHLFVPVAHIIPLDPAEYLLRYPFDLPENRKITLDQIQIEQEEYGYHAIMKKFGLTSGEVGTHRTAVLLKWLYDGLMGGKIPLCWNLERGGLEGMDYRRKVREFVYLLHLWVPGAEECQIREYRSRLTFCVNTSGGGKGVGLLFTENGEADSFSELEKCQFADAGERKFFVCLAQKAQESADGLSSFVKELQRVCAGQLNTLDKFLFAYHRKRMNEKEPVTESEVLGVLSQLESKAETDPWYQKFFIDFLMQADLRESSQIASYWVAVKNFMKRDPLLYGEMVQVATKLFLSVSSERGGNMASQMSEELKEDVLRNAYEIKKDEIHKAFDFAGVGSVERFCAAAERYRLYWNIPEFGERMFLKASKLYEEDASDKAVRKKLSSIMEVYGKERWKEELEDFYGYKDRMRGYYLSWLQIHADTVEETYVPFCYAQMLLCAEEQGETVNEQQLGEVERYLRENAGSAIPKDAMDRYQKLAEGLRQFRLSREIASLKPGDLSGLLSIAPAQLSGGCLELWSEKAGALFQTENQLQLEDFKRFVLHVGQIRQMLCRNEIEAGGGLERLSQSMSFYVINNKKKEYAAWYCFYEQKRDSYWNWIRLRDAIPVFFEMLEQPGDRECLEYLLEGMSYRAALFQLYAAFRRNIYISNEKIRRAFSGSTQSEKQQFLEAVEAVAEAEGVIGAYSRADYIRFLQAYFNKNGEDLQGIIEHVRQNPRLKQWVADGLENERTRETDSIRAYFNEMRNIEALLGQEEWSLIDLAAAVRSYNKQKKEGMEDRELYYKIDAQMRRVLKEIEEEWNEYEKLSQIFYGKIVGLKNVKLEEKTGQGNRLSDLEAQGLFNRDQIKESSKAPKTVDTKYPETADSDSAIIINEVRVSVPARNSINNAGIIAEKRQEAYSQYDW